MGEIRKIGDLFYIEFYARGLLYSQVAGTDYQQAKALLEATENKINAGEALTVVRTIDLPAFFQQFLIAIQSNHSPKTQERFQRLIEHFQAFLKSQYPQIILLSEITPAVIESYKGHLRQKQIKPKVIILSLLLMKDVLEFGIKLGFIHDNPTVHVKLLPMKAREFKRTQRLEQVRDLMVKQVGLARISHLLQLTDIGRLMYFAPLIATRREDLY